LTTAIYPYRSPLPETQLFFRNLTGGEVLSSISHYQLVALSPSANLPLDQLVGHPVTIEIDLPKGGVRYVHQYVASMVLSGEEGQYYRYEAELGQRLTTTSYFVASSFFLSGILNYLLARWIVVSPAGTSEFAAELGKMTALSYPVIVIPSMIVLIASLWYLLHSLKKLTGLDTEQLLASKG
jgi:uncharacterized protein involved in type VI secretion and phage assembly